MNNDPEKKIAVFEAGHPLEKRKCPIDGKKVKSCIHCKTCAIMKGFGGAGAFSDGKYNITNQFGGTLYQHIGKDTATELMEYVDKLNLMHGGEGTKLYSTTNSEIRKLCLQNGLHLLDASVRHLGTDINYIVLQNLYEKMKDHVDFYFDASVDKVEKTENGYAVTVGDQSYEGTYCIISAGRSGSKWMESVCTDLRIPTLSNRVDIGVRVELPAEVFSRLTDELYESKIVYRTEKFEDMVRTFCMNPRGVVVNENTNGIITVNGHSYEDPAKHTNKHKLCTSCIQTFLRAVPRQQRIRREHCKTVQHAWRRCYGSAFRRPDPWKTKHKSTYRREFCNTDAFCHTGRFKPCYAKTYPGWHHRDDLCTG